ncbi:MAG: hypothetical protein ABJC09_02890 [Terriglobia bacterium]
MNKRALLVPLVAAGIAGLPLRADVGIAGPVLGYYVAPSGYVLHAISGVAGSATLGPSLTTDLDAVWVAPDSRTALGLRGGVVYLLRDIRNPASRISLSAWSGPIDDVVWASDSSGVVLYSAERGLLQAATGLSGNPAVSREINITGLGGPLLSLRLSANPWNVALVVRTGSNVARRTASRRPENAAEALYLLNALGAPVLVAGISRPGPMDFSSDAKSLYVVDETANQLKRVSGSMGATIETVVLNSVDTSPANFSDLSISPDGTRLLIVDKKRQSVCGIGIASGDTEFCTALDFSPAGMKHLSGSLYFLDAGADPTAPLWILDSDPGRIFFVPMGSR